MANCDRCGKDLPDDTPVRRYIKNDGLTDGTATMKLCQACKDFLLGRGWREDK